MVDERVRPAGRASSANPIGRFREALEQLIEKWRPHYLEHLGGQLQVFNHAHHASQICALRPRRVTECLRTERSARLTLRVIVVQVTMPEKWLGWAAALATGGTTILRLQQVVAGAMPWR